MSNFAHIHLHTDFSCLDGYGTVEEYAQKASENDIRYLCVTDHGMGAAYPRMIEECAKHDNLTPVFGSEVYVNNHHHLAANFRNLSDEEKFLTRRNFHLILIAKTNKGYENLVKLISEGWINGFYYKPRVSWETIKEHSEGLYCATACLGSEISQLALQDRISEAEDLARQYKEVFQDRYFIEVQMIKMEEQDKVNKDLIRIAAKLDIPIVVTNDVHYCEQGDSYNQTIELLLNSKGTINNRSGLEFHTDQLWYKTPQEMDELWEMNYQNNIPEAEYKEAKANTIRICESCDVEIDTSPKFPKIENSADTMLEICISEMKRRGLYDKKVYRDRFLKEYGIICEKGYPDYFICVKKIVDYSKSQGYSVGPGRGSGAGSLICYLLDITGLDPIKHDLLFERFLSPSRGGKFVQLQFNDSSEIK